MTLDRELLELAAKAAGIDLYGMTYMEGNYFYGDGRRWSPLTDDGHALRLAVTLGLAVSVCLNMPDGDFTVVLGSGLGGEKHNTDPYAATRRAIVLAAAEIGRNMK